MGVVAAVEEFVAEQLALDTTGGYQKNHVGPVIRQLQAGLTMLPPSIKVVVLPEGPWADVQPVCISLSFPALL